MINNRDLSLRNITPSCVQSAVQKGSGLAAGSSLGDLMRAASPWCGNTSESSAPFRSCFQLLLLQPGGAPSESPCRSSAGNGALRGSFKIFLSWLNLLLLPQILQSSTISTRDHWHVLLLRDFHGNLSKEDFFHSPSQPTGEVTGPVAFSITDLGTALLLPPTPPPPCYRLVSVLQMEGTASLPSSFPSCIAMESVISPTSMAGRLGTAGALWSRGPRRNFCILEEWELPAGERFALSAVP